jgi:hypothetical protein
MRSNVKNWIVVASLLVWQLAPAASLRTPTQSEALPCHGMDMSAHHASEVMSHHETVDSAPAARLPPCCVTHNCQGDCMHSPALAIPVVLIPSALRDRSCDPVLREACIEARVAEFFRPPI